MVLRPCSDSAVPDLFISPETDRLYIHFYWQILGEGKANSAENFVFCFREKALFEKKKKKVLSIIIS